MSDKKSPPVIVIADDSEADRRLAIMAFKRTAIQNPVVEVEDGEQLMEYLLRRGRYAGLPRSPEPILILLDINMPRKTGLEALAEIRANPDLRGVPIVMLTTSKADEDIVRSYDLGVNSFVTKPVHFEEFVEAIRKLGDFWLRLVELPPGGKETPTRGAAK
jgi:CheY-like chemotaxis protein